MSNDELEKIVREYVDKSLHMSLATVRVEKPWVCEVHFVFDDDLNLYWRSKASSRHSQEICDNPNVAGNIVRQHAIDEYPHAVYFEGKAEQMVDLKEQRRVLPLFISRIGADGSELDEAQTPDGHKFYKVTVENWYAFGKFGRKSGDKYKLSWNGGKKSN